MLFCFYLSVCFNQTDHMRVQICSFHTKPNRSGTWESPHFNISAYNWCFFLSVLKLLYSILWLYMTCVYKDDACTFVGMWVWTCQGGCVDNLGILFPSPCLVYCYVVQGSWPSELCRPLFLSLPPSHHRNIGIIITYFCTRPHSCPPSALPTSPEPFVLL